MHEPDLLELSLKPEIRCIYPGPWQTTVRKKTSSTRLTSRKLENKLMPFHCWSVIELAELVDVSRCFEHMKMIENGHPKKAVMPTRSRQRFRPSSVFTSETNS